MTKEINKDGFLADYVTGYDADTNEVWIHNEKTNQEQRIILKI